MRVVPTRWVLLKDLTASIASASVAVHGACVEEARCAKPENLSCANFLSGCGCMAVQTHRMVTQWVANRSNGGGGLRAAKTVREAAAAA